MDFYYQATDLIKKTESTGQNLMIDSFILGYMVGAQKLNDMKDLQKVVDNLHDIRKKIDDNQISPFTRDEFFIKELSSLFDEKTKPKKSQGKKELKNSQQTNLVQSQSEDQQQFQQKEIVEESQNQNKIQKQDANEQIQPDSIHGVEKSTKSKGRGKGNKKSGKNQDEQKNETK